MKLYRDIQFLNVILVLLLFVGGCAAPAAPPPESAPIATAIPAAEAAPAAAAPPFPTLLFGEDPRDQVLRIAVVTDASSLDPARAFGSTSSMILHSLYQTLVTASSDSIGVFEPNLAESWEFAEDAQSITLFLRKSRGF